MRRSVTFAAIAMQLVCNTLASTPSTSDVPSRKRLRTRRPSHSAHPPSADPTPTCDTVFPSRDDCFVSFAIDPNTVMFRIEKMKGAACTELLPYQNFIDHMRSFLRGEVVQLFWPVEVHVSGKGIVMPGTKTATKLPTVIDHALHFFVIRSNWHLQRYSTHCIDYSFKELEITEAVVNGDIVLTILLAAGWHVEAYFNLKGPKTSQEFRSAVAIGVKPYKMQRTSRGTIKDVDTTFWERTVIPAMPYVAVEHLDGHRFHIRLDDQHCKGGLDILKKDFSDLRA